MLRVVYAQESLPGVKRAGPWRRRLLAAALFVVIVGLLLAAALLPTTLPFRDRQLLRFSCAEAGSIGLCDRPDTVAHFFAQICGRGDVTVLVDQSRFRTGLDSDHLVPADFSVICQPRTVSVEGITRLERIGHPDFEQTALTARLFDSWQQGDLTTAEAREQLLGTP